MRTVLGTISRGGACRWIAMMARGGPLPMRMWLGLPAAVRMPAAAVDHGPVPGFVAFYAASMIDYATARGIAPEIADRAVRQLFLGAGTVMSVGAMTPADHVRQMTDYAGTTAAGLEVMQRSSLPDDITKALDSAVARTRSIG